ncbi:MAG: phage tail tape measure protein [Kiritimatiellae bacterium]|nr:phage tail tape measure protein [Kiritimatiellia bacterium]
MKDQISSQLERIKARFGNFAGASEAAVKRFNDGIKMMGLGVASMAAGFMLLSKTLGEPVRAAADFQAAMAEVGTLIPGQAQALERLSSAALDLSMKFGKSQKELASAEYQAISAGIAAEHAASFVETSGKMAIGGVTDTKTAVDGLTSVINAYKLSAEEAGAVSDTFFVAMKRGKTTVGELASVVGNVAPLASATGVAYDELFSAIAAATLTGQSTAEAATGIKGVIAAIVGPSDDAAKAAQAMGLEWNIAGLKSKGLIGLLQEMYQKTGGNVEMMRTLVPRIEGFNTMLGLSANNCETFASVLGDMAGKAGAAEEAFATMSATLKFKWAQLGATFDVIKTKIGNALLPIVTVLTKGLMGIFNVVAKLPSPIFALLAAVLSFAGGALVLGGAMLVITGLMKAWVLLKPMIAAAFMSLKAQALGAVSAIMPILAPLTALIALGAALYYAWQQNWGGIRDMVTAVVEGFRMAVSAGEDGIASVDAAVADKLKESGIWDFAVTMGRVFYRVRMFIEGFIEGVQDVVGVVSSMATGVWNAVSPLFDAGRSFLEMLGILDPVAETSSETWREWGHALGVAASAAAGLVLAFKGFSLIGGILSGVTSGISALSAAFAANPIGVSIMLIVGALFLVWSYWDEIVAVFNAGIEMIKGWFSGAAEWISEKWEWIKSLFTWEGAGDLWGWITAPFTGAMNLIRGGWEAVKSLFTGFPEFIGGTLGGLTDIIFAPFKAAFALVEGGIGLLKKIWDGFMSLFSSEVTQIDAETAAKVNSDAAAVSDRFAGSRFLGGGGTPIPGVAPIATHEEPEPVMLAARSVQDAPAAPILAAQKETDAALAAGASGAAAARPVEVKSDVSVTVEPVTQDIVLDGEKIGEYASSWVERQNMRAGRSSLL